MSQEARTYKTAQAFRKALEDRLKKTSVAEKLDFQRLMREVAFDRLLARDGRILGDGDAGEAQPVMALRRIERAEDDVA